MTYIHPYDPPEPIIENPYGDRQDRHADLPPKEVKPKVSNVDYSRKQIYSSRLTILATLCAAPLSVVAYYLWTIPVYGDAPHTFFHIWPIVTSHLLWAILIVIGYTVIVSLIVTLLINLYIALFKVAGWNDIFY